MNIDDIEPVNLLEDGINESIQVQSIQEEEKEAPINEKNTKSSIEAEEVLDGASTEEVEEVEASESTSESDEESEKSEPGETKEAVEVFGLEEGKLYDLGDGVTITGKEAINRLKTENRIRQKFGELGSKEHQLKQREAKLNQDLQVVTKHLQNLTSGDNKLETIKSLVSATGVNPNEWFAQLVEELTPAIEEYNNLDDSGRELRSKDSEIQRLQAEIDAIKNQTSAQRHKQDLASKVNTALQAHGLSEEDFQTAYADITAAMEQGQLQQLKNADEDTALSAVIDYALNGKTLNRIDNVLDKIDPTLKNDNEVIKQLYSVVRNPYRSYDVTDEDLEEIVRASFGDGAKDSVPAPKVATKPKKDVKILREGEKPSKDPFSLDDIEPMTAEDMQYL